MPDRRHVSRDTTPISRIGRTVENLCNYLATQATVDSRNLVDTQTSIAKLSDKLKAVERELKDVKLKGRQIEAKLERRSSGREHAHEGNREGKKEW